MAVRMVLLLNLVKKSRVNFYTVDIRNMDISNPEPFSFRTNGVPEKDFCVRPFKFQTVNQMV
jgi:hypothetical protein